MKQASCFCAQCDRQVLAFGEEPNHILHLLITVLLCGCWLPFWLLLCLNSGTYRCSRCGAVVRAPMHIPAPVALAAVLVFSGWFIWYMTREKESPPQKPPTQVADAKPVAQEPPKEIAKPKKTEAPPVVKIVESPEAISARKKADAAREAREKAEREEAERLAAQAAKEKAEKAKRYEEERQQAELLARQMAYLEICRVRAKALSDAAAMFPRDDQRIQREAFIKLRLATAASQMKLKPAEFEAIEAEGKAKKWAMK